MLSPPHPIFVPANEKEQSIPIPPTVYITPHTALNPPPHPPKIQTITMDPNDMYCPARIPNRPLPKDHTPRSVPYSELRRLWLVYTPVYFAIIASRAPQSELQSWIDFMYRFQSSLHVRELKMRVMPSELTRPAAFGLCRLEEELRSGVFRCGTAPKVRVEGPGVHPRSQVPEREVALSPSIKHLTDEADVDVREAKYAGWQAQMDRGAVPPAVTERQCRPVSSITMWAENTNNAVSHAKGLWASQVAQVQRQAMDRMWEEVDEVVAGMEGGAEENPYLAPKAKMENGVFVDPIPGIDDAVVEEHP